MTASDWTQTETELARCLIKGDLLDVTDRPGNSKNVRSEVIRELLLGRWPEGIPDATVPDPRGLRLRGATVMGRVDLDYLRTETGLELLDCAIDDGITARQGQLPRVDLASSTLGHAEANEPALNAEGFTVTGNLSLVGGRAHSRNSAGTIYLSGGHIGGEFRLSGGTFTNESGPALYADRLTVDSDAFLDGLTAIGQGEDSLRLIGGHISGQLVLRGATLTNESGSALTADNLAVDSDVFLDDGFAAIGHGENGAVRLLDAHIGGELYLRGARLTNESGPALSADNLAVDKDALLDNGFAATGHGENGAVRLLNAHIGGQLTLRGGTLTNESGPALSADGLTVDSDALLDDGFAAIGHGENGAVRLLDAHIGGQLTLRGGTLTNESGPGLYADGLTVDSDALLDNGFAAIGHGENGAVRLADVAIKQELLIDLGKVESSSDRSYRLVVDGLTYRVLSGTSWGAWLELLRSATPSYAPQPYRQLAATTTAAGHDSDTRRVLIAQRRDQLARASLKRRDRLWGHFTGLTLGYGYQPWRALVALIAVTLVTALLMALPIGARGLYVKDHPDQLCPRTDRIVLGVDTALPLVTIAVGTTCLPRPTSAGQVITVAGLTAQILGWAFATLFVAGFTGAVRKT